MRSFTQCDFLVRKALSVDAEAACAVLIRSITEICAEHYDNDRAVLSQWLANKTPDNVRRWIECDRWYCVVAVHRESEIVGFASISGNEIMLNYVVPEVLHKGLGKAMLRDLENYAIASDARQIRVVSSITAKDFYRRHGYVPDGPPQYVGTVVGDFPLRKDITA